MTLAKETPEIASHERGLSVLMMGGGEGIGRYYRNLDECWDKVRPSTTHPFGLDIPEKDDFFGGKITLVEYGVDTGCDVFVAAIRQWAGCRTHDRVNKLRRIVVPMRDLPPKHHCVLFEVWMGKNAVLSHYTTNFSGAGNHAREVLQGVLDTLSAIYSVEIEEVVTRACTLSELSDILNARTDYTEIE